MVEQDLDRLLQSRMPRGDNETWLSLTNEQGPLSNFYKKIRLTYAMRVIDAATRDNIDIVRKIRNTFAHTRTALDFNHDLIIKELKQVRPPNRGQRKIFKEVGSLEYGTSSGYVMLCFALSNYLMSKVNDQLRKKTKRLDEKFERVFSQFLIQPLNPSQISDLASLGALSLSRQSGGPNLLTQGGLLSPHPPESSESDDNEGTE